MIELTCGEEIASWNRSDGPARQRNGLRLCAFTAACSCEDNSVIISVRVAKRPNDSSRHWWTAAKRLRTPHITFSGGTKPCRISSTAIYQALGVKKIRKRPSATKTVLMRQLLSLDFVLKHSSINWLPAEPEKVEFFEKLGVPLRLLPRRIYCGVVGGHKRYFALKMPLAVEPEIVTFVYVDPGHQTHTELYSWGAAHGPLWDALREKGRRVRVIGIAVENAILDRTNRVLGKMGGGRARGNP